MKVYLITVFIYDEGCNVIVSKKGDCRDKNDTMNFDIKSWFGEPDWHKIMNVIGFFNAQYINISPRFGNADELTSEPKEIGFNEETGEVINYE